MKTLIESVNNRSRTSLVGVVLFALAACLIYNQATFNSRADSFVQAQAQVIAWEDRLSEVLTIRGHINGIVESVSQEKSVLPILKAASKLQAAWERHSAAVPAASQTRVGAGIDQVTMAAMRTAEGLRRQNIALTHQRAQSALETVAALSQVLKEVEHELMEGRQRSESERQAALESMNIREGIGVSAFFVLGVASVGLLALGLLSLAGRFSNQPQHAVATTSRGFSLIEVLMVVAITLVLSTIAIANIAAVVSSSRIRAGISSMSGLLQNCRMLAVKKNRTLTAHVTSGGSGTLMGYVKDAGDTSPLSTTDTQVKWEAPVVRMTTPTGPGAPGTLSTTVLGYTPQTGDISFNSRGLPCAYSSGVCTNYGFLYYFKDTSRQGPKGWAALSISPAGKIKKWFWNNHIWTD